ncbi:DNA methylase [Mycobacterium phage LOCV1]|nr:DNA methylase [Mycobacterium phage LOCV1]WDW19751.1 DNA methylase [Mycobacterium phage LOCV2]WDW19821.1 DNA methylase [Mycobacterium phage LOCV3]WDW19891.1 DNA methylase [Mycobacterium phage LOCV4]WDW19959.1 DNA methylase [Mycobacterium phage LOCV5]WDW20123.1 DNA methylase [Mycobacterium phage Nix22]
MTKPYYQDGQVTVFHGDCLHVLAELPDASVDAIVTDPPYGIGFMGKEWDSGKSFVERKPAKRNTFDHVGGNHNPTDSADAARTRRVESQRFGQWCERWAAECLRVLKPGGHMLAFGGSRTWHRLAAAIEDAGFEVRDSIAWLYGSGFPKSLDVSKAIDKAAGAEREVIGEQPDRWTNKGSVLNFATDRPQSSIPVTGDPATEAAWQWQGWGTALKPAFEPIVVARKPLAGTVAANVLGHGTGALNIDACRVGGEVRVNPPGSTNPRVAMGDGWRADAEARIAEGRWPTNVVLDETQAAELDAQTGTLSSGKMYPTHTTAGRQVYGQNAAGGYVTSETYGDSGGASRFFPVFRYEAKAPGAERPSYVNEDGAKVAHNTVKPLDLMRWLVRLVTPPNGVVLDPFAGSGTTAEACIHEHKRCITIEREADYLPLIVARLSKPIEVGFDFGDAAS